MLTSSEPLRNLKAFSRNHFVYSYVLAEPERIVDLFDLHAQFWSSLPANPSTNSRALIDEIIGTSHMIEENFQQDRGLVAAKYSALANILNMDSVLETYRNKAFKDREQLGRELSRQTSNLQIYEMVQAVWDHETSAKSISSNTSVEASFLEAAKFNLDLVKEFYANTEVPDSDLELLVRTPTASELLKHFVKKVQSETETTQSSPEEVAEGVWEELAEDVVGLKENLEKYFTSVWEDIKAASEPSEVSIKLSEAKGVGTFLGDLIAKSDPKLGEAVKKGSTSAIEAYECFLTMAVVGFKFATFSTGVGAVLGLVSALNGYFEDDSAEESELQFLYEGLEQINEKLDQIKNAILAVHHDVLRVWDRLSSLLQITMAKFGRLESRIDRIVEKIDEHKGIDLEIDFQKVLGELSALADRIELATTEDEGNDCLTDLYQLGILRASNIAFTRTKEDINSVYEYLSLDSLEGYDSFKWSPLENRPVLIERLRKRFLQLLERGVDEDPAAVGTDIAGWKNRLVSFGERCDLAGAHPEGDYLVNPILARHAFEQYLRVLLLRPSTFLALDDVNRTRLINKQIRNFFGAFSWFNEMSISLSDSKVLRLMAEEYTRCALKLVFEINRKRKSKLEASMPDTANTLKIKADPILLSGTEYRSKAGGWGLEQEILFRKHEGQDEGRYFSIVDFLSSFVDKPFRFNVLETFPVPVISNVGPLTQAKKEKLDFHYSYFTENVEALGRFAKLIDPLTKAGILEVKQKVYVGTTEIDVNRAYMNDPFVYGELTIEYTYQTNQHFEALNQVAFEAVVTFADTKLGPAGLFNASMGSRWQLGSMFGTGSIYGRHGIHDPVFMMLPLRLFSDDLKLPIHKFFSPDYDWKSSIEQLHETGVFVGMRAKSNFGELATIETSDLRELFQKTREAWINLTTAVLIRTERWGDSSLYLELLQRKPRLLDTSISLADPSTIGFTSGEDLSDLLLLWVARAKDAEGIRKPFFGINVTSNQGGSEPADFLSLLGLDEEETQLPLLQMNFETETEELLNSYSLHPDSFDAILSKLLSADNPAFYDFVFPSALEGADLIRRLCFFCALRQ